MAPHRAVYLRAPSPLILFAPLRFLRRIIPLAVKAFPLTVIVLAAGFPSVASASPVSSPSNPLPALNSYIQNHCDFAKSQWCRVQTYNTFADVMWRKPIPGMRGCCDNPRKVIDEYNGAAFDGRHLYFQGGGHADYGGNEVYELDLGTLKWARLGEPAPLSDTQFIGTYCPVPQGGIFAGHTYGTPLYFEGKIYVWSQYPKCHGNRTSGVAARASFDLRTQRWTPMSRTRKTSATASVGGGQAVVFEAGRDAKALLVNLNTGQILRRSKPIGWIHFGDATVVDNNVFLFEDHNIFRIPADLSGPLHRLTETPRALIPNGGIAFDPRRNAFFFWSGGPAVFSVDRDFKQWHLYLTTDAPAPRRLSHVFSKWHYVPTENVFIGVGNTKNIWLFRPGKPINVKKALGEFKCSDLLPGAACPNLQKAVSLGGLVKLKRGIYNQCATISKPTSIDGNGSIVEGKACGSKAAFIVNADFSLSNITCKGIRVPDGNGACIRQQRGTLSLDHVVLESSQEGILSGRKAGDLSVHNSMLQRLGGDCAVKCGRAHGIYYDGSGIVRLDHVTIREPRDEGHLLKTGAIRTVLDHVDLDERDGFGSRSIDAFNGGVLEIRNSKITAAKKDGNKVVIGYDFESRVKFKKNIIDIQNTTINCAGGILLAGAHNFVMAKKEISASLTDCH